jgi:hypothetical protein
VTRRFLGDRDQVFETSVSQVALRAPGERLRITGVAAELDGQLRAPIAGTPCLGFRLAIEAAAWRSVLERTECVRFRLTDGEASVIVEGPFRVFLPARFRVDFGNDVQIKLAEEVRHASAARRAARGPQPQNLLAFFKPFTVRLAEMMEEWDRRRSDEEEDELDRFIPENEYTENYRYFEGLIRPGDPITVEGFASTGVDPAGERSALRATPLRVAIFGSPAEPTLISLPQDREPLGF